MNARYESRNNNIARALARPRVYTRDLEAPPLTRLTSLNIVAP